MQASTALGLLAVLGSTLLPSRGVAAPSVWVIDDGEKVRRDATSTPFERGEGNPVWHPGEPVRLFAMRSETVALQVVVEADDISLEPVTVDVAGVDALRVERFVEHFLEVRRPSGGRTPGESLGWERGAGPRSDEWVGPVPDALVPVDVARLGGAWLRYPMSVAPRSNGVVWVDLDVPGDARSGVERGAIRVRAGSRPLADIPLEIEIAGVALPDRSAGTMLYYDPADLSRRIGPPAEAQLWKLLHAHRIAPMHDATSPDDVDRQLAALDGTLYTAAARYSGPSTGVGDGVLSLGAYGAFGAPDERALARVESIADRIERAKLFGATQVFLYAVDEQCSSPWGSAWRSLLRGSHDESVRRLPVAWTCSQDPATQPVDLPILQASWDPSQVQRAREQGKEVWVYNGVLPHTGTFLLDAPAVSPRVNGWLSAMFHVPRWFYWESTFWYGQHDARAIDPFVEPETLHDAQGDWANGDGVLLYPGSQNDAFREHSLHFEGVLPSIRLKNWRRGLEDAGYLEMARARDPAGADAVARWLIPAAFDETKPGRPPSWSRRGQAFFEARRALLAIVLGRPPVPLAAQANDDARATMGAGCLRSQAEAGRASVLLVAVALLGGVAWRRRRRRS